MEKNKKLGDRGITLIALIVTIIVLLILAGVSIAVLTGENGILNRATEAKQTNEQKTAEEELKLGIMSLSTDYYSKTTRPATFREFVFTAESQGDLNKYLSGTATFNTTNYTITYKNVTYQVAENGTLSIAEGLVLLDKLVLINGVDTTYQLTADQKNIEAPSLTWTSSTPSVATVGSTTGLVTVVGQGETTITVSGTYNNKNYSAECDVTISALTIELGADREIVKGGSETLTPTITPSSVTSREDITINWTSSATSVATVSPATGASTTVSVLSGATTNATSTITVSIKKVGQDSPIATDTCTIKAILSPYIDSSYVQYNVAYTDVYTGTTYNQNTGWRLLTDVSGSEYTGNIEIISTGIPAGLRYNNSTISSASWAGTEQQRKDYLNTTITDRTIGGYNYSNRSYTDYNIYAAAGLLRNFESIVFSTTVSVYSLSLSDGIGGFVAISNNGTALNASNSPTGENLFKVSSLASGTVSNIRSVNLWDIKGTNDDSDTSLITDQTDKKPGLFRLDQYTPDQHSGGRYWLASPSGDNRNDLRYVDYDGRIGSNYNAYGVRPVVSITGVKMQLNGNVWQIVANSN